MEGLFKLELDGIGLNLGTCKIEIKRTVSKSIQFDIRKVFTVDDEEGFDAIIDASELVLDSVVAHGLFLIITASVSSLISSSVSPLELLDFSGVAMGAITSPLLSVF